MRSLMAILILAHPTFASEPNEVMKLRARAALALVFAPPTYAEQYAKALKENKPLVVFVGQNVQQLGSYLCVSCATFPDAEVGTVVIGWPDGGSLRRKDLTGSPSVDRIREALRQQSKDDRNTTTLPRQ